jgi:hypothetical protein
MPAPEALTDDVARELYGIEAGEVLDGHTPVPMPVGATVAAA